jgi:hypothetical protein
VFLLQQQFGGGVAVGAGDVLAEVVGASPQLTGGVDDFAGADDVVLQQLVRDGVP